MGLHDQYVRLSDVSELITKGTTPTTLGFNFTSQGIGFLRVQNIDQGQVFFERDVLYIDEKTHLALKRSQIKSGDVLVSIAGSIGRAAVVPKNAPELNCNQALAIVRVRNTVFQPYLRYWLESSDAQSQIRGATVTGTISNLSLTQLGNLKILLPPIAEQKRIAAILDKAEELRSLRRKALGELDAIAQSIFLEMFGDPSTNLMKWEKGCLGDVATFIGGGTPKRECPEYFEGSICWATSKDMKSEFLDDTQEHITPEAIKKSATNLVPINTILIVVKSKILMHSLPIAIARVPTCFGQDIKGIKVLKRCEVTFVATALRYGKRWLLERARGINTEGLTLDHLKAFPLLIPPIELQQEFARRVEAIERLKTTHRESIAQLDALFASLQHRAFRGEL
ncbi:restriction modification system DNA specificity subunit (plasmid) [Leptolyngbya sp. NIES-3755]|nr:restriction modification system DNA specificity subunit [Leptolyngbya sp. NIES-3755]